MVLGAKNIELFNEVKTVWLKTTRTSVLPEFSELYATFSKTKFSVKGKMEGPGMVYTVKLDCFFPGFNAVKLKRVGNMALEQFSVRLELTNGSIILIASLDEPLNLILSSTTKQTQFTFSGQTTTYITNESTDTNNTFSYVFPVTF